MSSLTHQRTPVVLALAVLAGCQRSGDAATAAAAATSPSVEVSVFAAASLRDALVEVGRTFEQHHGAVRVQFNFAGSNVLAQQIVAAPGAADVFLSADLDWIDFLEREGLALADARRPVVGNRIVVVAHGDARQELERPEDLAALEFRHLVVANPEAVPGGRYARRWLEGVSLEDGTLWDAVADRVAPALDARAALALVESTPDAVGIVYASDVEGTDRVQVIFEPAPGDQPEIVYGAVQIERADAPSQAGAFLDFLSGPEARASFEAHGFLALAR